MEEVKTMMVANADVEIEVERGRLASVDLDQAKEEVVLDEAARAARRAARTVGVVSCAPDQVAPGYVLLSVAKMTYLLDLDGRVAHSWTARRNVFVAYLLADGALVRDGSDLALAPQFRAGGASGFVEKVTWDNEPLWSWTALPRFRFLSHHDLQPLENGNVLVLVWERKSKEEALAAGRHPELLPDGEMWNNLVVEIGPSGRAKDAVEVWRWNQWDHLVQDYDEKRGNYVADVAAFPNKLDVNYCPPGGKAKCRNGGLASGDHCSGLAAFSGAAGKTGERDWLHANSISYSRKQGGLVVVSYNVPCEIVVIRHRAPEDEGIVYRFGNPLVSRRPAPDRTLQTLFVQHSAVVVDDGVDDDTLTVMLFNNGCAPRRMWSTVEEYAIDASRLGGGDDVCRAPVKTWTFGAPVGHLGSFYAHHSSGVRKLENGNALVTLGPQGVVFEVSRDGTEVWRYISPVETRGEDAHAVVKQGDQRGAGKFGLFFADKYSAATVPKLRTLRAGYGARIEGPFLWP